MWREFQAGSRAGSVRFAMPHLRQRRERRIPRKKSRCARHAVWRRGSTPCSEGKELGNDHRLRNRAAKAQCEPYAKSMVRPAPCSRLRIGVDRKYCTIAMRANSCSNETRRRCSETRRREPAQPDWRGASTGHGSKGECRGKARQANSGWGNRRGAGSPFEDRTPAPPARWYVPTPSMHCDCQFAMIRAERREACTFARARRAGDALRRRNRRGRSRRNRTDNFCGLLFWRRRATSRCATTRRGCLVSTTRTGDPCSRSMRRSKRSGCVWLDRGHGVVCSPGLSSRGCGLGHRRGRRCAGRCHANGCDRYRDQNGNLAAIHVAPLCATSRKGRFGGRESGACVSRFLLMVLSWRGRRLKQVFRRTNAAC